MPEADAVVDLEEGDLEVGLDAVRVQQPLDRADQRVLAAGARGTPGRAVEVAEALTYCGSGMASTARRSSAIARLYWPFAASTCASASRPYA